MTTLEGEEIVGKDGKRYLKVTRAITEFTFDPPSVLIDGDQVDLTVHLTIGAGGCLVMSADELRRAGPGFDVVVPWAEG